MERKQQIKFEIDGKEQEYLLRMEKIRLEMERVSEENRIKVAEAKMVETVYLEESEIDQHLELAPSVDRRSDRLNDWVDHALERTRGSSVFFEVCNLYKYKSGSHQHRLLIVINNDIPINQPSPSAMAMESSTLYPLILSTKRSHCLFQIMLHFAKTIHRHFLIQL